MVRAGDQHVNNNNNSSSGSINNVGNSLDNVASRNSHPHHHHHHHHHQQQQPLLHHQSHPHPHHCDPSSPRRHPSVASRPSRDSGLPVPAMHLPLPATLPSGKEVVVSHVPDPEVPDVYAMIEEASRTGDGYGVNEFSTEAQFLQDVREGNGKILQVCDPRGEAGGIRRLAAFVLLDSRYFRGPGTMADCYVIVQPQERRQGVGEFCLQMAVQLARRLGYLGIYSDTFSDNVAMRRIVEKSGFRRVGYLPVSARMPDGTMKPSTIYYLDLSAPPSRGKEEEEGVSDGVGGECEEGGVSNGVGGDVAPQDPDSPASCSASTFPPRET